MREPKQSLLLKGTIKDLLEFGVRRGGIYGYGPYGFGYGMYGWGYSDGYGYGDGVYGYGTYDRL